MSGRSSGFALGDGGGAVVLRAEAWDGTGTPGKPC
jgi:hypothetical protein